MEEEVVQPWENLSTIDSFEMYGINFLQGINLSNDSVYLVDLSNNVPVLEFSSDCVGYELYQNGERGSIVARFRLVGNNWVTKNLFTQEERVGHSLNDAEGLLKDEVVFCKEYVISKYIDLVRSRALAKYRVKKFREPHPDDEKNKAAAQDKRARKAARNLANLKR